MQEGKIKSSTFNQKDAEDHKKRLADHNLARWQQAFLNEEIINQRWLSETGNLHPEISKRIYWHCFICNVKKRTEYTSNTRGIKTDGRKCYSFVKGNFYNMG